MQCAIVGPHLAAAGEAVRVDVIVRGVPSGGRLRIRLERMWPEPSAHVDEWTSTGPRSETTTFSFLWRAEPWPSGAVATTAVLRASVVTDRGSCASTHGVAVMPTRDDRLSSLWPSEDQALQPEPEVTGIFRHR